MSCPASRAVGMVGDCAGWMARGAFKMGARGLHVSGVQRLRVLRGLHHRHAQRVVEVGGEQIFCVETREGNVLFRFEVVFGVLL